LVNDHFQLNFEKGKFPIRFACTSFIGLLLCWAMYLSANWQTPILIEPVIGHVLMIVLFVGVSVVLIHFFNDTISQMSPILGVCLAWLLIVLVAVSIYIFIFLLEGRYGIESNVPVLRYLQSQSSSKLLVFALLLGFPYFWTEKETYTTQALVKSTNSDQFSNLGFRIRPHFLFNTLNSVAHLISLHPARAEKALYNLADVFRVVMADKRDLVPLKAELELAEKYLFLEKTRLGERLQVATKVDPHGLGVMVPVLLLQPLLENAVYHGIETRFKGGTINMSVQVVDKHLIIQITNPLPEGSIKRSSGNKVAQENLRERIYRTFGSRGTFDAYEADERYTVTLRFPL